ncbi:MAG TPA: hypothetical protein VLT91_12315 [Rhizomicrobium sp.]|nr:hypothetical protein [Rhizomicrobium sp.]
MKELGPYILPLVVIAIMARRLMRNRPRKVKVNRIFWFPAFIILATAATLWSAPMPKPWLLWIPVDIGAVIAGLVIGFLSAHHQEFSIDYDTGAITSKATPIGTIVVLALFAAKFGLKFILPDVNGSPFSASGYIPDSPIPSAPHSGPAAIMGWTDAGILLSAAMLFARAFTTWLRAQPLIHAHKDHVAAKAEAAKLANDVNSA